MRPLSKYKKRNTMSCSEKLHISSEMKLADVLLTNERLLLISDRIGLPLGMGDKTITQCCREQNLNIEMVLMLLNMYNSHAYCPESNLNTNMIPGLVQYLSNAHFYYLNKKIPYLQKLLTRFIEDSQSKHSVLLRDFFTLYAEEVKAHMEYEDQQVFPYIQSLLTNTENTTGYSIDEFSTHHSDIEEKLTDLKHLLIKHFPPTSDNFYRNLILLELFDFEYDINDHNRLEDTVLVPLIKQLEERKSL